MCCCIKIEFLIKKINFYNRTKLQFYSFKMIFGFARMVTKVSSVLSPSDPHRTKWRKKRNRTARLQRIETADMVHGALLRNLKVR